jgi:hypothetical protein
MKKHAVAVFLLCAAVLTAADSTRVLTGTLLNLYSLKRTPFDQYSTPCSVPTDTLNRYDFSYHYLDRCLCICPCCPMVILSSPRPFYMSTAPMNYNQFNPSRLGQDFTRITGNDPENQFYYGCTIPTIIFGAPGSMHPRPLDSIRSRLFVFLTDNGGTLPFYLYMLVHIDTLRPRTVWCNIYEPAPGGQYYPLYDTTRISLYTGPIASVKPDVKTKIHRIEPKGLEIYSITGKRVVNGRLEELSAGIYLVNGRTAFLQNNTPQFNRLKSKR